MEKTTIEKSSFKNSEELNQKWAEETAKVKIAKEAYIRVAITEDGDARVSMDNLDEDIFLIIMTTLNETNNKAFASAAAAIAAANLVKHFADFLNNSEEADSDGDDASKSDSDSSDGEKRNTPEAE